MSRRRELLFGGALCLALPWGLMAMSAVHAQSALQAPSGTQGWWASSSGGETCVSDRSGARASCWLESGRLSDLRETAEGWIAAGRRSEGVGDDLFLMWDRGRGAESLVAPEAASAPRGRPILIADDVSLLGLVWLEGSSQDEFEVRSAEWLGDRWGKPTTVSPAGDGSQVAQQATVLADGSWLLVWTAFDGSDDETVWSRYRRGRWSPRAAVHEDNDTPDILPTLVTTERGAIAAWSWLDGRDYRLRTAFFDGEKWRVDPPAGARGSLEARFFATSGAYLLSFETVVPEEWVAWEFDDLGRVLRRASIQREGTQRPRVEFVGSGVSFRRVGGETQDGSIAAWDSEP